MANQPLLRNWPQKQWRH